MKNVMIFLWVALFTSLILIGCGGGSIDDNSWSGKSIIAGVVFSYSFETKSDNTFKLTGNAAGIPVNESGTFKKINDNEIVLTSGEFNGDKFVKDGSSLKWYLDNGDYFMTLY